LVDIDKEPTGQLGRRTEWRLIIVWASLALVQGIINAGGHDMTYRFPQNPNLQNMLSANPNLMICEDCDGTGSNPEYDELNSILFEIQTKWPRDEKFIFIENCKKCGGDGYIDRAENVKSKRDRDCKRYILKGIRHTSVLFLYSCLYADNKFVDKYLDYDSEHDRYNLVFLFFEETKSLKYFSMYVPLVEKYLLNIDKEMFEGGIKSGLISFGLVCAGCFYVNSDEFQERGDNEFYLVRPKIGEKIYTDKIIAPDNIEHSWFCNKCQKKLSPNQIYDILCQINTKEFPCGLDPEYGRILYENTKIKVFY
jgi:hypothetical protein